MAQVPKKILIVRPSAIGDIAMASPMLRSLAQGFPGVSIAWLIEPAMRAVLAENSYVDQLLIWPKAEWRRLFKGWRWIHLARQVIAFRRALRQEKFDLVLDAQGLLRSRLLSWLSGAPTRIGFDSKEPGRFLMSRVISRGIDSDRMSSEYLYMIQEIGLDTGSFHQSLDVGSEDEEQARKALDAISVAGPFVAAAPFTTRPQKHWLNERWSELGKRLHTEFGWPVVLLGGPADMAAAVGICAAAEGAISSLAGELSLSASMAVLKRADLVVGVDTGLTHMGPAFKRSTIALFGATCPYLHTSRSNTRVIYHKRDCSPCKRSPSCDGAFFCMQDITVDEVVAVAHEMLENGELVA
jgi:heptosyltransferase-1